MVIENRVRSRLLAALFVSQGLFTAAVIASFTLSSLIASSLGQSDSAAGLPSTLTLVGRAIFAYPIARYMNQAGRRAGLSFGYLIGIVGAFVSFWAVVNGSLLGFLVGALIIGAMRGAAELGRFAGAEIYPPEQQARVIGLIVFAGTLGSVFAPALVDPATRVAEGWGIAGYSGPFLLTAIFLALAGITVFAFLRPDPLHLSQQVAMSPAGQTLKAEIRPIRQILEGKYVRLAIISITIGQLVMAFLMVITPVHMNHAHHPTAEISQVIMAHTLGMFGFSAINGWIIDRVGRLPTITFGTVLLLLSCIAMPIAHSTLALAVVLFALGLGWNFCFVAGSSLLSSEVSPAESSQVQGTNETLVAIATAIGSLGTGIVFEYFGIGVVAVLALALTMILVVALVVVAWPGRDIGAAIAD